MQGSILARIGRRGGTKARNEPGSPQRRWHWVLLVLALAGFGVWLIRERIQQSGFHWDVFASSFLYLHWGWMLAAWVLALLTYYGRALRWKVMLRPLRPEAGIGSLFRATAVGFAAVVLLGRPGEFVRPYLISVRERVPLSSQLAAWLLERILDLLAILVIFGVALTQLDMTGARLGPGLGWVLAVGGYVLGAAGALSLLILVMLSRFSGTMRHRLVAALRVLPERHHGRVERIVGAFVAGTAATQTPRTALSLLGYTILEWGIIVLSFLCLFRAYPATAGFRLGDVLVFMGFIAFGSVIQIPGVGGGIQIVSMIVLTELFGLPLELATSIAIMIWLTTLVVIVPLGLFLACHEGLNWRRLRELEREAQAAEEVSQ